MDSEDAPYLTLWTAKPPPKPVTAPKPDAASASGDSDSEQSGRNGSVAPSEDSSSGGDINFDGSKPRPNRRQRPTPAIAEDAEDDDDSEEVVGVSRSKPNRNGFFLKIPYMSEYDKEEYKHLPGHFRVREVISQPSNGQFIVRLASDETEKVSLMLSDC